MEHILFSIENKVGRITFNRPEVYNAMHQAMRFEILEALDICTEDPDVRAVFITGNGKAFCAGEDLQEVTDQNQHHRRQVKRPHVGQNTANGAQGWLGYPV